MSGWNINVVCNLDELKLGSFQAKLNSLKADYLKQKYNIVSKDTDGNIVRYRTTIDGETKETKKNWVNESGQIVDKAEVKYYIKKDDGSEVEIQPYTMTKTLEILKFVDLNYRDFFLITKKCEISKTKDKETEKISQTNLLKLAQYCKDNKCVALTKFTFGRGFKSYLGLISPIFIDKLFTLNLDLAEKKTDYKNLMPIDIKETEVKKKKTLEEVIQIEV